MCRDTVDYDRLIIETVWIRDGPIDTKGGGLGFFLATSYFFLSLCTTSYFFKSKLQRVFFYFFENNTLKSEKCKRKQHIE